MDISSKIGWANLDEWSETYIGARWIVDNKLPDNQYKTEPVDGPLSQMVLIASHQLVEVMLFKSIRSQLESRGDWSEIMAKVVKKLAFNEAFNKWPKILTGISFPKSEPITAARILASRRNATVHSESAITTLEMARSALYTGEMASRAIEAHFGNNIFSYENIVSRYNGLEQKYLSESMFPKQAS